MLGIFLLCICAVITAFAAASFGTKPALASVAALASIRFLATAVYQIDGSTGWEQASGWLGLPLAAAAFYLATALMVEDARHRTVLPLLRRGAARSAMENPFTDQVSAIAREAGVRGQL
jgi:succinate-acetate transporter protein